MHKGLNELFNIFNTFDSSQLGKVSLLEGQRLLAGTYINRYIFLPPEMGPEDWNAYEKLQSQSIKELQFEIKCKYEETYDNYVYTKSNDLQNHTIASYLKCYKDSEGIIDNSVLSEIIESNYSELYKVYLVQASIDLVVEAAASTMSCFGHHDTLQPLLFRILIDEYGYGNPNKKHSYYFCNLMTDMGLENEYLYYWKKFRLETLQLHNWIHYVFQNPNNIFLMLGFLLIAEISYQKSTSEHSIFLKNYFAAVDPVYFDEHAHIDKYHSDMALELANIAIENYGTRALRGILSGMDITNEYFRNFEKGITIDIRTLSESATPLKQYLSE